MSPPDPISAPSETPLFRREAVMHRSRALYGDVVLRGSLPGWIITALLCAIVFGVLTYGLLATIDGMPAYQWALNWISA